MSAASAEQRRLGAAVQRVALHAASLPGEVYAVWTAVCVFLVGSISWLVRDSRVPDYDSGYHMLVAMSYHNALVTGPRGLWFTSYDAGYPPLVHLLGAMSIFVLGDHAATMIMSSNVVFVPLLAFGCYGAGRVAGGRRAGLLAALFALGTPIFVSMMHEYDLDPPQAALVAVSVWAMLGSRRFERTGVSVAAGVLTGLALMTKETSVVFLAGPLVVMILRGGWRAWRGLAGYVAAALIIAGPWYVDHLSQITTSFATIGNLAPNPVQAPPRLSVANAMWYVWNLVNQQVLAVFSLLAVIGILIAIRRAVRDRGNRDQVYPELLVGLLVSYVGMTYLTHKDPRYTLPGLVYIAVFGTFWIPSLRHRLTRHTLSLGVVALATIYFAGMTIGIGGEIRIALPGAQDNMLYRKQLTLYQTIGWVRGGPITDAHVLKLLQDLHRQGVLRAQLYTGADELDFNVVGIEALAATTDVYAFTNPNPPSPQNVFIFVHTRRPGDPPPCQTLRDGVGIYVAGGNATGLNPATLNNPADRKQPYELICPGRPTVSTPLRPG